jgi:hypothetical protein
MSSLRDFVFTTIFLQNKSPEEIILKENGYTIKRPEKWK